MKSEPVPTLAAADAWVQVGDLHLLHVLVLHPLDELRQSILDVHWLLWAGA